MNRLGFARREHGFLGDEPPTKFDHHDGDHALPTGFGFMRLLARVEDRCGAGRAMTDVPTVDLLLRHLQAELEASASIPDPQERGQRQRRLEAAIQEAILFNTRFAQRVRLGLDPTVVVDAHGHDAERGPIPSVVVGAAGACEHCAAPLDPDLDFCARCGGR